jgi:MFS family permease
VRGCWAAARAGRRTLPTASAGPEPTGGYAPAIAAARSHRSPAAARVAVLRPSRGAFAVVGLALFVLVAGANLATPLYAVYRDRFGFSSVVLTLVFATYQLVLCPSLIVFGQLSDRIGRRPVVAGGLAVAMLGLLLFALATDTAWLFGARAVQGLAVGAASGAATAALVELAPEGAAARAALVSTLAQAGGSAAGPLIGGALAEWAPAPRTTSFVVGMVATGVVLVGVLIVPRMPAGTGGRWRMQRPDVPPEIRAAFARFALTAAAAWAVAGLYLSVVPSYAGSLLDTSNLALEGAITATMLLASCAAQIAVRGSGRPARDQSAGLALVIVGLVALVAAFPAHSLALVLAAALLGGVGHGMAFLGAQSDLNAIAPPDRRGEITAAFFVCIYLGVAVSAIGVGLVATLASLETAVAVFAVVTGAASVAAILWHVAVGRGEAVAR